MKHPLAPLLLESRIVAILRGVEKEQAAELCDVLVAEGLRFLEIPLNTPDALDIIGGLAARFRRRRVHIGAGTVLTPAQVEAVAAVGGEYIISPDVRPAVIRRTVELGLLSMPGFRTPTEACAAVDAGAHLLKLFPCGSPREIAVLKSVVPLPVFAVGGIDAGNLAAYLETADGVGVGTGIFHPGMTAADLRRSVRIFLEQKA